MDKPFQLMHTMSAKAWLRIDAVQLFHVMSRDYKYHTNQWQRARQNVRIDTHFYSFVLPFVCMALIPVTK